MIVQILKLIWRIALPLACACVQLGMSSYYSLNMYEFSEFCGISFIIMLSLVVLSLLGLFISICIPSRKIKKTRKIIGEKQITISSFIFAFAIFIFGQEKVGFNWAVLLTIIWSISIIGIIFLLIKTIKADKLELINQRNKVISKLSNLLRECKQEGSLKDIEILKNLIEENKNTKGSNIEFFDLNFVIAKIFNNNSDKESAETYFSKVENIILNIELNDLCIIADNYLEKKRFFDSIYIYTCILEFCKFENIKNLQSIPNIYYCRATAYSCLKQHLYRNMVIDDLKTAIVKTKDIINITKQISKKNILENNLDNYNYEIAEIYKDIKDYKTAITYFSNIKNRKNDITDKLKECHNLQYQQEQCNLKLEFEERQKAEKEKGEKIRQETELKIKQAEPIYERAVKEFEAGMYYKAKLSIQEAITIVNMLSYKNFLKEIDKKLIANNIEINEKGNETTLIKIENNTKPSSENKKIKLDSCTKDDLLTIDGLDEEKADKFIQERDNGKIYYDIDNFVSDYGLIPHQMIEIQERLVFSPKPKNKMGRKIDW